MSFHIICISFVYHFIIIIYVFIYYYHIRIYLLLSYTYLFIIFNPYLFIFVNPYLFIYSPPLTLIASWRAYGISLYVTEAGLEAHGWSWRECCERSEIGEGLRGRRGAGPRGPTRLGAPLAPILMDS